MSAKNVDLQVAKQLKNRKILDHNNKCPLLNNHKF